MQNARPYPLARLELYATIAAMEQIKTEGVVLKTLDFGEYDRLLTVYTPECGLIKIVANGANRRQSRSRPQKGMTAPLCRGEFAFQPKSGELFKLLESRLIDPYLPLRQDISLIQTACDLAQALTDSQLLWKPAPKLYRMLFE